MAITDNKPRMLVDENGHPMYACAMNDQSISSLRTTAALTTGTNQLFDNNSDFDSGYIPTYGCPVLYLWVDYTFDTDTDLTFIPRVAHTQGGTVYDITVPAAPSSGSISADDALQFTLAASVDTVIPIINPGAKYMLLYWTVANTVTSTDLILGFSRGFNNHVGYVA